jgi:exonuclease SbcD
MRVVICGDSHIGAVFGLGRAKDTGGNTRVDDYEKSLNYIIDHCIDTSADIFIQTGDLFEHRTPTPEHINIANRALKRLSKANIATVVIMGNHDYRRSGDSFTSSITSLPAKDYPNVRLIIEPEVVTFFNSKNEGVNILLMPYRDKRMYSGESCAQQSAGYEAHVRELCGTVDNESPIIAVGHNFYYEGSYNDYGGSEVLVNANCFEACDLSVMGHLHTFRILKKKSPPSIYIGSMERTNFGDADVDKYFIDYDVGSKKASFYKTPTRDLVDAVIDISDASFATCKDRIEEEILKIDMKDKIVRLKVSVNESVLPAADKLYVQKLAREAGAFFVSRVTVEPVIVRIVRDNDILDHEDDYEMFSAFIASQGMESKMKEKILSEAKKIIG